jgi:hypothetical protein
VTTEPVPARTPTARSRPALIASARPLSGFVPTCLYERRIGRLGEPVTGHRSPPPPGS